MPDYYVEWRIDIVADSPEESARKALKIQRDPESWATVFHVHDGDTETMIDLTEIDEERQKLAEIPAEI